ncbi:MAG: DUF5723 family protein, partial [bacterium]|nr:DUF5723 family protein [bacterium]
GVDAARYNPANLGIGDFREKGLEIFGAGVNISNNSFTLDQYNKYTGAFLTDRDKADILNTIPDEGLAFSGAADLSALSFSLGQFVVSAEAYGAAEINLNKDVIDLLLNGNSFGDSIQFNGSFSEAVSYSSVGLSYARSIYSMGTREIAVGLTLKYLHGFGVEEILEMEGFAATLMTGFQGEGRMIARTASGGSGYGLDIGSAVKLNDSYTAGISIKNFLSNISWNGSPEEHGYLFSFDTVTVDNKDEDFVVSDDYTRGIESFSTTLPSVMTVGVAQTQGAFLWAIDWEQGFRRAAGASSKPRIAAGIEYSPLPFFPLRTGFSAGGNRSAGFSFGVGLNATAFYLDLAAVTGSSVSPGSSKGLNVAVTSGLRF